MSLYQWLWEVNHSLSIYRKHLTYTCDEFIWWEKSGRDAKQQSIYGTVCIISVQFKIIIQLWLWQIMDALIEKLSRSNCQ